MNILKQTISIFSIILIFLLLLKNCEGRKIIRDYEKRLSQADSILNLPPSIDIDTFYMETEKLKIVSIPQRIDTVYKDTIKNSEISIFITDTLSSDSTIKRSIDYSLIKPIITTQITEKVPVIIKEKQKRVMVYGGLGTDYRFTKPIASIGCNYLFDRWTIGGEFIYDRTYCGKINIGVRF